MITDKFWFSKNEFNMKAEEYCGITSHPDLVRYKLNPEKVTNLFLKIDLLNSVGILELDEINDKNEDFYSIVWWQKKNLTYIYAYLFERPVIIEFCYKDHLINVEEQRLTVFFNEEAIGENSKEEQATFIKRFCDSSDEKMQEQIIKCRGEIAQDIISGNINVPSSGFQVELSINKMNSVI